MLILLPPSEGKSVPRRGKPLDLQTLSFPELTTARSQVLSALIDTSAQSDALKTLKVAARLADTVAANMHLMQAPTALASQIYNGVLYDAFDVRSLDAAAKRRATRSVVIASALWGVVRLTDRIPAYRLSMGVTLPRIGSLGSFWKNQLAQVLAPVSRSGLIVDCRSDTYAVSWHPKLDRFLGVRVFREVSGERTVVSHMAKHSRGLVARALLSEPRAPQTAAEAVDILNAYFATHEVRTAADQPVAIKIEFARGALEVITS